MDQLLELKPGTAIGYGRHVVASLTTPIRFGKTGLTLLVGRNGRGKSTFLKYLCGCLEMRPPGAIRTVYLPEELGFSEDMPPSAIARACLPDPKAFEHYAARAELPDRPWRSLSKGTRQQVRACLSLALADAANADLLCLDEMFSGMDYAVRRTFWGFVNDVRTKRHVLLSLHPETIRVNPDSIIGVNNGEIFAFAQRVTDWNEIEMIVERGGISVPVSSRPLRSVPVRAEAETSAACV